VADYREINRANWGERAPAHPASPGYASPGYNVPGLVDDPGLISSVVSFDRPRLGEAVKSES
jgi:hypothetical protein